MATTVFDTTTITPIPVSLDLTRLAREALKREIKEDAVGIRAAKAQLRGMQREEAAAQAGLGSREREELLRKGLKSGGAASRLHGQRQDARARLGLYAFLRGRTWAQFEPNHAEECPIQMRLFQRWKKLAGQFPGLETPTALKAVCPARWFEVQR